MQTRTKTGIPLRRLGLSVFLIQTEPKFVKHALKYPMWLAAMKKEYSAL